MLPHGLNRMRKIVHRLPALRARVRSPRPVCDHLRRRRPRVGHIKIRPDRPGAQIGLPIDRDSPHDHRLHSGRSHVPRAIRQLGHIGRHNRRVHQVRKGSRRRNRRQPQANPRRRRIRQISQVARLLHRTQNPPVIPGRNRPCNRPDRSTPGPARRRQHTPAQRQPGAHHHRLRNPSPGRRAAKQLTGSHRQRRLHTREQRAHCHPACYPILANRQHIGRGDTVRRGKLFNCRHQYLTNEYILISA